MTGEMSAGTYIDPGMDGPVPCIHVATLCQELESLSLTRSWTRASWTLIDSLLVVDHSKGPTAAEALEHPYLRSIKV